MCVYNKGYDQTEQKDAIHAVRKDLNESHMKTYQNENIIIHWFPDLCTHPGTCLKLLPNVFDNCRRPWVDVNAATPEEIIKTINECPSGALRYSIPEGSSVLQSVACGIGNMNYEMQTAEPVKIRASAEGPLFVEGHVQLLAADGTVIKEDRKMALCSCGHSQNKPFCDGSHRHFAREGQREE